MKKNEVWFRFCIWKFDDITHAEISEVLGVTPSKVYIKGERKNPNFTAHAKYNGWLLDASDNRLLPFSEQLDLLLDIIELRIDAFSELSKRYYCEFSCGIYIYTDSQESTPAMHLTRRYHEISKHLNAEFDVDIILLAETDE